MEEGFNTFLIEFRVGFIEFFVSQCNNYNYTLNTEKTKKVAEEILDNLLAKKIYMSSSTNNTIVQMKKDGVSIGFLLNKVFLYTIDNYLIFLQRGNFQNPWHLKKLIQILNKFSYLFESHVKVNLEDDDGVVAFSDNNYIYSRNNILDIFKDLKNGSESIEFMNLYQGYPIKGKGKVVNIDGENVVFKLESELQEVAMKLESEAYIVKDKYFHRHVKADIVYSNFSNNTIVLNNFIYLLNLPAVQRKYPRIYPDILIHAKLIDKDNIQAVGNLYDLSQNGIGMISEENLGFYNGAKINIEFEVTYDGEKHRISTMGEMVDIMQYMKSYRYCLRIYPNADNREIIAKYIQKREEEIKQELKDELNSYIF